MGVIESEKSRGIYEAGIIKNINPASGEIIFEIGSTEFSASINNESFRLANDFFEKSKKLKSKIEGALLSVEESKLKIQEITNEGITENTKVIRDLKPEKKWYEKFRWLRTANDFILVCGKDASQNEVVVKKSS